MASRTNNDEVMELAEGLDTNYPVNTEPQKPGSSAKFYAVEGQWQELVMTKIDKLVNQFDNQKAIEVQIKELTNKIDSLKTFLEKQCKEKENEIQKLKNELTEKEEAIQKLQKEAVVEADKHKKEMETSKSENQKLTTDLASCEDARTGFNKIITAKEEIIQKLQKEAVVESDKHKKEMETSKSEIQKLTTELASCEDARTGFNKIITAKEEIIQKLQKEAVVESDKHKKEMETSKSEIQKLTTDLASCEDARTGFNKTIKLLQSDISDLQKEISELDPNKKEIFNLKKLLLSDDSHRRINEVDLRSNLSENSTKLRINNKKINYVTPGTFDNLSSLTELNLLECGLTFLEKGVFNNLTNLTTLGLSFNYLTCLEGDVFAGLKKLNYIYLHSNNITKLPPQLFRGLESLKEIGLSNNKISVFDEDLLVGLNQLTQFIARDNNLSSIPVKLFQDCVKLEKVWLYSNKIIRLKKTIFDSLHNLNLLYLHDNPLNEMDKNSLRMLKIEDLRI